MELAEDPGLGLEGAPRVVGSLDFDGYALVGDDVLPHVDLPECSDAYLAYDLPLPFDHFSFAAEWRRYFRWFVVVVYFCMIFLIFLKSFFNFFLKK